MPLKSVFRFLRKNDVFMSFHGLWIWWFSERHQLKNHQTRHEIKNAMKNGYTKAVYFTGRPITMSHSSRSIANLVPVERYEHRSRSRSRSRMVVERTEVCFFLNFKYHSVLRAKPENVEVNPEESVFLKNFHGNCACRSFKFEPTDFLEKIFGQKYVTNRKKCNK